MSVVRVTWQRLVGAAVAVVVAALVLGSVLGQPVLLSYVTSDSMEPAVGTGDGFVAVPTAVAGPIGAGDVVVYRAQNLRDGGLVTHRVVDRTRAGYVTKGDGNAFTDQAGGEPPVPRSRIVAVALTYDDRVVVIPHLGTAITAVRDGVAAGQTTLARATGVRDLMGSSGTGYLLLGTGVALLAGSFLLGNRRRTRRDTRRERSRETVSVLTVVVVLSVLVAGPVAVWMGVSGGQESFTYTVSNESRAPGTVEPGATTTGSYTVTNRGTVPVVVTFEPQDGVGVDPQRTTLSPGESVNATVTLHAPDDPGPNRQAFVERRYFALLPTDLIVALAGLHPLVAVLAVAAVPVLAIAALVVLVFGRGPLAVRSRHRGA